MEIKAPIAIFIYKRPCHLKKTLEHLKQCDGYSKSPVIIYADGAKDTDEYEAIKETREIATEMLGDKAEYHFSQENKGLAKSVIEGVTKTINRYGRVIVLEDDLLVSPYFLTYMNKALEEYKDTPSIKQISAHMFPVKELNTGNFAFFLPFISSWGWATWKTSWADFDPDATGWEILKKDKEIRKEFNLDNSYDYYSMILKQMNKEIDSWAICWYWSVYKQEGLVLYPPTSLVNNIGFDGSGTHGWKRAKKFTISSVSPDVDIKFPQSICINQKYQSLVYNHLKKSRLNILLATIKKIYNLIS